MSAEMSLQNFSILCAIENSAPRFEFANAVRRFLRVQLSHAPLIHILTAAHCIGEMHLPVIAFINIGQGRRDSAFGHYGVRFAEKRFANESNPNTCSRRFDSGPQPRTACANDKNVVLESFVVGHG